MDTSLKYRPEIDGLRAVAVISVILFHLDINVFSGGFTGVDIFFVISGYLVTRIVARDINAGTFTFSGFYLRRIRRLVPALVVTVLATLVLSVIILTPQHFERLAKSSIAAIFSFSNIFFSFESGYFDVDAWQKPLLHTWSLSVEEQFYLVWPLFIFICIRIFGTPSLKWLVAALFVVSLVSSVVITARYPEAAFFITPIRMFEFAAGGIALFLEKNPAQRRPQQLLPLFGIVTILYCVFTFSSDLYFPGYIAIAPCLGALLVITGSGGSVVARALSFAPLVYLGKISYSLYLAHWPIIVLYKYVSLRDINTLDALIITLLTGCMALCLYYFVELKFRYTSALAVHKHQPDNFTITLTATTLYIISICAYTILSKGAPVRFQEPVRNLVHNSEKEYNAYTWKNHTALNNHAFVSKEKTRVLVIGDSMAGDFLNILAESDVAGKVELRSIVVLVKCQPVLAADNSAALSFVQPHNTRECATSRQNLRESELLNQADIIFLAGKWAEGALDYINGTVHILEAKTSAEIFIVGNKGLGASSSMIVLKNRFGHKQLTASAALIDKSDITHTNNRMRRIVGENHYIDLMKVVCPSAKACNVLTPEGNPIFYDPIHITADGTRFMAAALDNVLEKIVN